MLIPAGRASRTILSGLASVFALVAAGCTGTTPREQVANTQPRVATYRCGDAGNIRVTNTGAVVIVSVAEGVSEETGEPEIARYELVAAPPNQRSRYGAEGLALVLESREALWMKAGQSPLDCTR